MPKKQLEKAERVPREETIMKPITLEGIKYFVEVPAEVDKKITNVNDLAKVLREHSGVKIYKETPLGKLDVTLKVRKQYRI